MNAKRFAELEDDWRHGFVPETGAEREAHAVILELLDALADAQRLGDSTSTIAGSATEHPASVARDDLELLAETMHDTLVLVDIACNDDPPRYIKVASQTPGSKGR